MGRMSDYLVRSIAREAGVRAFACVTTALAQEAAARHETQPTATAVLAEGLTGAALMGALLKVGQRVAVKFEGDGPLHKLVLEADSYGRVRGYVGEPAVDLPQRVGGHDIAGAIGSQGRLFVIKDLRLKELAEGVIALETGAIDEALTQYLDQSEQIPSAVQTDALLDEDGAVLAAGGVLLQALPPYDAEIVRELAERLAEMPPAAQLLQAGETPEDVLAQLFGKVPYEVLEERPLRFQCSCSWERTRQALLILGREEIEHLLATEGQAEIDCHFCHAHYIFTTADLELILLELAE